MNECANTSVNEHVHRQPHPVHHSRDPRENLHFQEMVLPKFEDRAGENAIQHLQSPEQYVAMTL
jgi:hypothetical protein